LALVTSQERRVSGRRVWIAVCLVTALAAVLRLTTLGLQSYEFDEAATLYVIHGSFTHMLHGVARNESTPPLYYVLAWVWARAFSTGEGALRLLSALAGVATVPVVYAVGRTLASRRIGLVAAALVATSPYLVFYSQEARSYALFALLSTAGVLCCIRAIQRPTVVTYGLWAGVSIAALATHYFAVFPWVGQVVAVVVFGASRRLLAWSMAAVGLASVPLLLLGRHQAGLDHATWIGAVSLPQRIRVTAETFALGATFKGTLSHTVLAVCGFLAVVMAAGIVVAGLLLVRRAAADERRAAELAGLIAAVAFGLPLIGALGPADYFLDKNLIPLVPLLAVVLAAGLGCRRAGRLGIAGTIALVVAGIALTVMSFAVPSMRRPDVRQLSRQLGAPARERVLAFVPRWRLLLEHYQGQLDDLPPGGRRVTEVDVFTAGDSIPQGTVPPGFRLVRVQHGSPFTLFSFRSRAPLSVTPDGLGHATFSESGLQPIAVVQAKR
jgi:4-amino-4-deoxy-L-arabinose transferase-like glycosyltransferase